ncbi:hypothetical protein [uncultured Croceitalea sp.]|uniref:hypothetical protein n=1 Tax=uncultured Croceitalea sp. TaxID=1798908 RepID=UPI00374E6782
MEFLKKLIKKSIKRKTMWIVLIWVLIANFFFFQEHWSILYEEPRDNEYNFSGRFLNYLLVSTFASILGGLYTINLMESWLAKYPFWKSLLLIFSIFLLIGGGISLTGATILAISETGLSLFSSELWTAVMDIIQSWLFIKTFFLWFFIIIITLIVLKIRSLNE